MTKKMTSYKNTEGRACMKRTNIAKDVVLFSIAVSLNTIEGGIAMAQAPAADNSGDSGPLGHSGPACAVWPVAR